MTQLESPSGLHALVLGASGLAGWVIVDQILSEYSARGTFAKVTALVNRPLSMLKSCWLNESPSKRSLYLFDGINLMGKGVEDFTTLLRSKIKDVANVTHTFYFAYKQEDYADKEIDINLNMLGRAVGALNSFCPKLQFLAFPSDTKGYGFHLLTRPFNYPSKKAWINNSQTLAQRCGTTLSKPFSSTRVPERH